MMRIVGALLVCAASTASAQRGGGVGNQQPLSMNTDHVLTITGHGLILGSPVSELVRNNCNIQSNFAEQTVIRCDKEERPDMKDRVFQMTTPAKDGTGCELTIRYVKATSKWNVEFKSLLGARCSHSWRDNDSVEIRP